MTHNIFDAKMSKVTTQELDTFRRCVKGRLEELNCNDCPYDDNEPACMKINSAVEEVMAYGIN